MVPWKSGFTSDLEARKKLQNENQKNDSLAYKNFLSVTFIFLHSVSEIVRNRD